MTTTDNIGRGRLSYGPIDRLSDDELLASTRRLAGSSNQILAALLAHLAEVETRGLHRNKACSSLYTYCIYELRFSEDAASRRVCAARLAKRFPLLLEAVANGELHLTGLLMLGPYITSQNQLDLLARAKFRTKKELSRLVRILDPLPDVAARIVPLGPAPTLATTGNARPNWQVFAGSLCPVRELSPGDRPGDWIRDTPAHHRPASEAIDAGLPRRVGSDVAALARELSPSCDSDRAALARELSPTCASDPAALARELSPSCDSDRAALTREVSVSVDSASAALAPGELQSALTAPQRYQVQFTAGEEHVQLIERAKALLSVAVGNGSGLAEIHLRAMRVLVAELEARKYGAAGASRLDEHAESADAGQSRRTARSPRAGGRVRYVPAAERRAVFERDGARCSYVDARGQRCRETSNLELHHLIPFARDGAHVAANLALFCRTHNALAAEEDFGRGFVEARREKGTHESWVDQHQE